jgi:hypothetical protein
MTPLLNREEFQLVRHETTVVDGNVTTKFTAGQQHNKLDAKFCVTLFYRYGEEEQSTDQSDTGEDSDISDSDDLDGEENSDQSEALETGQSDTETSNLDNDSADA